VAATVPAVTGTPGAEGGGDCASAVGATASIRRGAAAAAASARVSVAKIAAFLMGVSRKALNLYRRYIIDKSYI
jgi:hypothetical protein